MMVYERISIYQPLNATLQSSSISILSVGVFFAPKVEEIFLQNQIGKIALKPPSIDVLEG